VIRWKKLRPRRWTFLVWSEQGGNTRQYSLTESLLRKGVIGALLVVVGLSTALAGFFSDAGERARHAKLRRENRLLGEQLSAQRHALDQLDNTLRELQKRDEEFRVLAGLEPLASEVYKAGWAARPPTSSKVRRSTRPLPGRYAMSRSIWTRSPSGCARCAPAGKRP
jgi:hypothetical protein